MKKKLALVLILMLSVCALVAALSACNKSKPEEPSDISRSVSSLLVGEDDDFAVSVESGIRETPFIADGKVGDVQEFCELTVLPLTVGEFDSVAYELYAAGEGAATLSGTLTESSFGEYKTTLTLDFVPAGIRITAGDKSSDIPLADVISGKLSSADAIVIARDLFAERIAEEQAAGKPAREIYLKLITGDRASYYYYVSFIGEGSDYWGVLIEPESGAIISKR